MVNHGMVLEALQSVTDPELHYDIVTLNMVRNIAIQGDQVSVDVALTVQGCPLHQRIEQDVQNAVKKLPGVSEVDVHLGVMNDEERRTAFARAFQQTRQKGGDSAPKAQAPHPPGQDSSSWSPLLAATSRTQLIGIASGKGGVGKSTVTTNLAIALHQLGYKVGVMDMDIYGYSQGQMFGVQGQAQANQDQKVIPWEAYGISLVSMSMFVKGNQAVVWRGPMLGKMMQQFFTDVAWPLDLDYLLIDLPPGTGDVALDMATRLPKALLVIVTTPQTVAKEVAMRTADVAQRAQQRILGVIENMSYVPMPNNQRLTLFGEGGGEALSQTLEVPLLGQIPLESSVREGGDRGVPIVVSAPQTEASQVFHQIAQKIDAAARA